MASSRKNNSVYRPGVITWRRRPLNSSRQAIQARCAWDFRIRPEASCRMPRLPIRAPRAGVAISSLKGVTRFWRGMAAVEDGCGGGWLRRRMVAAGPAGVSRLGGSLVRQGGATKGDFGASPKTPPTITPRSASKRTARRVESRCGPASRASKTPAPPVRLPPPICGFHPPLFTSWKTEVFPVRISSWRNPSALKVDNLVHTWIIRDLPFFFMKNPG